MVVCLNKRDEIIEKRNYAEVTREKSVDVRSKEIVKFKEIIN